MATVRFVLKTLPGIDRPAIITLFPTTVPNKGTYVLDLGANVDSGANYLYQIAIMGSVLAALTDNIKQPKVALLNIGAEDNKGNQQIKEAAQMLAENKHINYVGFVEGDDIFKGTVDVIVCDGFIGNVMLKSIEGVLKLVAFYAKKNIRRNIFTKILALLALPILKKMYKDINPGKYNGATFIGLRGVVIKSHGGADITTFTYALEKAVIEAQRQIPQKISDELTKILQSNA
jgi:glycerol-3-phosphate acyltransferase PlsX